MKPILEIKNISKKFRIHHERKPYLSIRDGMINLFKSRNENDEEFWALKDVSFDVIPGNTIGIIGKNGAGKSTLLKILSKITPPTSGKIITRGRIASLLEVGTGFHPELTGRENIFLNGSILGMKKTEIQKNFDAIVDFSEIEKFLDTPLKHYSSGMQLRLAFAVAAFLENEILIIDEVLAVGDAEFQKKCIGKMEDVSKSGRTILFVSHNMGSLSQLCLTGLVLKKGEIFYKSQIQEAISIYLTDQNDLNDSEWKRDKSYLPENDIIFTQIYLLNNDNIKAKNFFLSDDIFLNISLDIRNLKEPYSILVTVLNNIQQPVFSAETLIKKNKIVLKISKHFLQQGTYSFKFYLHIPALKCIDFIDSCCNFTVNDLSSEWEKYNTHGYNHGNVFGDYNWQ